MYTLNNFQFHKFPQTSKSNFFSSNQFSNRQKSRTFSNGFYKNKQINSNEFSNAFSRQIPTNFSQQIPSKKNNYNIINKIAQDKFPRKKIISTDFETILNYGDSTKIDELLPIMIYSDLSFTHNNHVRLVLSKFQNLLRFLFSQQQNLLNNNNKIENLFNNKESNLNKKIRLIENEEYKADRALNSNNKQIKSLTQKIKNYRNILKNSGKEQLIPKFYNSNYYNKNGLFNCKICNGKSFKTYDEVQDHFIKEHYNSKTYVSNNNVANNNNITKSYLDNKLNSFKNDVKNMMLIMNQKNIADEQINNENNNKLKENNSNKSKMSNFFLLDNNEEDPNTILNRLEYIQKAQYEKLNEKFNNFKAEIFNEIKNQFSKQQMMNNNILKQIEENKKNENNDNNINNIIDKTNENQIENNNSNKNNDEIVNNDNNNNIQENDFNNSFNNNNKNKNSENDKVNFENSSDIIFKNDFNGISRKENEESNNKTDINNNILDENKIESKVVDKGLDINDDNIKNSLKNDILENVKTNILHSTTKYINNSKVIKEESGTLNDITQNDKSSNLQNNTSDNNLKKDDEDKMYTNTGESINKNSNIFQANINKNINNVPKISVVEKIGESVFENRIKERDDNFLLNDDKKMDDILHNYKVVDFKDKNNSMLEKKAENLINEKINKYYEQKPNLEIGDYEKIIKNIINDNKNNKQYNEKYKEFYDNIMKKNELNEILKNEILQSKISNFGESKIINEEAEFPKKNSNLKSKNLSINSFSMEGNVDKLLRRRQNKDDL